MYVDTHCHLSREYYDDIDLVINENKEAFIDKMIISGCTKDSILETLELVNKYNMVYATIGYHPDQVDLGVDEKDLELLEKYAKMNKKIIGIGEIGLDYHYDHSIDTKEKQKNLFEEQLKIAQKLSLPVVIHSRDAVNDTIEILKKYNLTGIVHCFSGSLETAKIYIKMGYKLGIGGVVTFKNSKLYEVVDKISLSDIVLETDSPYLTPDPYRGQTNSSKYIPIIAKKIADIKKCSLESVSLITTRNCYDLFDLKK